MRHTTVPLPEPPPRNTIAYGLLQLYSVSEVAQWLNFTTGSSASYLRYRTEDQRSWYSTKAKRNAVRATQWRYVLLTGELLAVVAAALAFSRDEPLDFAVMAAAFVAGSAAWLAIKQHSQLTSAYRIAAGELAI